MPKKEQRLYSIEELELLKRDANKQLKILKKRYAHVLIPIAGYSKFIRDANILIKYKKMALSAERKKNGKDQSK